MGRSVAVSRSVSGSTGSPSTSVVSGIAVGTAQRTRGAVAITAGGDRRREDECNGAAASYSGTAIAAARENQRRRTRDRMRRRAWIYAG
jgi:hypothetical protein